jgi:hypothetical protein
MKLKYNRAIGDAGVSALCDGLFTNTVLKVRHFHVLPCLNIVAFLT